MPPNSTAHLTLTAGQQEKYVVDGEKLAENKKFRSMTSEAGGATYELPAGTYTFKVRINQCPVMLNPSRGRDR